DQHGEGDAPRRAGGASRVQGRPHGQEAVRHRVLTTRGRARLDQLRLCLVTDRTGTRGRDLVEVVAACAAAGLPSVEAREKDLGAGDLAALCRRLRALPHAPFLIVNDRVDVALAVGAEGVQRTHASLSVEELKVVA